DLVGIHLIVRIPSSFELAKSPYQFRPKHLRQQCATRLPISMLAGKRAAVADHEIRSAFHEFPVVANAGFALQIETDPHVDAAMAEVSVESGMIVVFVEKLADIAEIAAHFFRSHRGIVPTFPFRRCPGRRRRCARAGFANLPNPLGLAIAISTDVWSFRGSSKSIGKFESQRLSLIWVIASKFDQQDSSSLGKQFEMGCAFLAEPVNDATLKSFESNRAKFQDRGHLFGGHEDVRVAQSNQRPVLGAVNQPEFGFEHGDARAFGAHERPGHVETVLRKKLVQVVARNAPGNLGITRTDERAVLISNGSELCIDLSAAATS